MLPSNWKKKIRKKEKFPWDLLPWFSRHTTVTSLWPYVFVPPKLYDNLLSPKPDPWYLSVMAHEFKHIEREEKAGVFTWFLKYVFLAKFRIEEELIADEAAMKYLFKNNLKFDIEGRAKMLSSWLYFHGVSYEEAREQLSKRWNKILIFS